MYVQRSTKNAKSTAQKGNLHVHSLNIYVCMYKGPPRTQKAQLKKEIFMYIV
jgi:hypothetical protein